MTMQLTNGDGPNGSASVSTLEQFNRMLNEAPDAGSIQLNKMNKNSEYLPISYVQAKLDEIFVGLWEVVDFKYSVIVNEVTGSVTLRYFHPFAKIWITRQGAASVMIQQASGSSISDVSAKIKNTLVKDLPHLLAECTKSAAKTIGKKFGRDLNRKFEDSVTSFYTDIANSEAALESIDWEDVKTVDDLRAIWNANPDQHSNKNFIKTFTYQKNKLKK